MYVQAGQNGTTHETDNTCQIFCKILKKKNICDKYVGHGVGSFLNVHEGPFGIGGGHNSQDPGLRENFFTSNGIKINFKQFTGIFSLSSRNNYHTCSSI